MHRLLFALLLLLLLPPETAAASEAAREGDRFTRSTVEYAPGASRAAGGLGLLGHLNRGGSVDRGPGTAPDAKPAAGSESPLQHVVHIPGEPALPAVSVFAPHCEHLPYHATAPPFPR